MKPEKNRKGNEIEFFSISPIYHNDIKDVKMFQKNVSTNLPSTFMSFFNNFLHLICISAGWVRMVFSVFSSVSIWSWCLKDQVIESLMICFLEK